MSTISKSLLLATTVTAGIALAPALALADHPHYVSGPTSGVGGDDIDYTVSFKEAGLGNTTTVADYTLIVTASVTYQCFNHGGNAPQGTPFTVGPVPLTGGGTFPVRNGSVTATITVEEPEVPTTAKCTGNGQFCAIAFSYTDAVLTDPFGHTTDVAPQTSSTPFLNCKLDR